MSADGARKLFVGGLADSATEADLRAIFEGAGFVVEHLALPRDRETGRLRGFAFITLPTDEDAQKARSELQGQDCCGRPLSIREFSQEAPKRGERPERGERPQRQEEPTVFLGKLPFDSTPEEIQELFASEGVGPVTRVTLPAGPDGRPRGFGFATLPNQEQVELAVSKMNGATLGGRQIVVSPAQPRGSGGRDGGSVRPPRAGGPGAPRTSDRAGYAGGGGGYEGGGFDSMPPEPAAFPPPDAGARTGRRKHDGGGRKEKKERKRHGGGEAEASGGRGGKRRRGGGASWHQWERDDE